MPSPTWTATARSPRPGPPPRARRPVPASARWTGSPCRSRTISSWPECPPDGAACCSAIMCPTATISAWNGLRAAGAVIVGKTTTPEFAIVGPHPDSRLSGVTRNPWDPALTPGGSSGGAVASVAAGVTPLAIGTDMGGSTRLPASYTGLVGLRPSTGRIASPVRLSPHGARLPGHRSFRPHDA